MTRNIFSLDPSFQNIERKSKPGNRYALHLILFLATFFTCTIAGTQWAFKDFTDISNWHFGLTYSVLILVFLSSHEFGHYIAARYHKVDATLPFYIPMPLPFLINFGTFGAVIKTRSPIPSRKALFDIGVSGPIAGFVVSVVFLLYGLMTLPPIDYIYSIHPEYLAMYGGGIPNTSLHFGDTILYTLLAKIFANPTGFLPPMNEIYHYPFLNVGWFGLFVTSLNLLPIGQLDGGHVVAAMFGRRHRIIARSAWWAMVVIGFCSLLGLVYEFLQDDYPSKIYIFIQDMLLPPLTWIKLNAPVVYESWFGWLFWALITRLVIKLDHPPVGDDTPLDTRRLAIGWIALAVLVLCFSFNGIYFIE